MSVNGFVHGQPLVVADSGDNGMTVYVGTMQDYVYAFKIPPNWAGVCSQVTTTMVNLLSIKGSPLYGQHPADACFIGNPGSISDCTTRAICPSAGVL